MFHRILSHIAALNEEAGHILIWSIPVNWGLLGVGIVCSLLSFRFFLHDLDVPSYPESIEIVDVPLIPSDRRIILAGEIRKDVILQTGIRDVSTGRLFRVDRVYVPLIDMKSGLAIYVGMEPDDLTSMQSPVIGSIERIPADVLREHEKIVARLDIRLTTDFTILAESKPGLSQAGIFGLVATLVTTVYGSIITILAAMGNTVFVPTKYIRTTSTMAENDQLNPSVFVTGVFTFPPRQLTQRFIAVRSVCHREESGHLVFHANIDASEKTQSGKVIDEIKGLWTLSIKEETSGKIECGTLILTGSLIPSVRLIANGVKTILSFSDLEDRQHFLDRLSNHTGKMPVR